MSCLLCLDLGRSPQSSWIDASFELRRPKSIFFPPAIQVPNQKEAAPPVIPPAEDAQLQNPPPPNQQEQAKEADIQRSTSSDKVVEALQLGAASASFEKDLTSTILPWEGHLRKRTRKFLLRQLTKLLSPSSK